MKKNGINLIFCLFKQFAQRQKYKFLEKGMEKIFMNRLFNIVENDEFVKNKINLAINEKSNNIF